MNKIFRQVFILTIMMIMAFTAVILSLNAGYSTLKLTDIIGSLLGSAKRETMLIVQQLRLPRILTGLLCGGGLGLSGCVLQSVTSNPLADPGVVGINAGAAIAVMVFMVFFPQLHVDSMILMPVFAFIGGMLVALFLYAFAFRNGKLSTGYFILGGIGAAAGINALMLIMSTGLENSNFQMLARWMAGSVWGTSWNHVLVLLPYLAVLIPLTLSRSGNMDILILGEEAAAGLGLKVERERRLLLFLSVGLASACIAVCGGISFIGLVSPHIARRLLGARHRFLLSGSVLTGMLICVLSDAVGRVLIQSLEIPVGVVVSVVAAPYFIYLLKKQNN